MKDLMKMAVGFVFGIAVSLLVCHTFMAGRYQIVPSRGGMEAIVMDTWTGEVKQLSGLWEGTNRKPSWHPVGRFTEQ